MKRRKRSIKETVEHPTRRKWIEALWHSSEALSPKRFHSEFLDAETASHSTAVYHVEVLVSEGIATLDRAVQGGSGGRESFFVLGGPNSVEALRRLELTTT
ncbi:MAG TPA: hypothetical protein VH275_04570 [Solirubrobacterales bacterium]|jgi:DNA-binding transcriptional ArsR family regulator|nr:hypothetical protein [Solirubrobacterales bacterium]